MNCTVNSQRLAAELRLLNKIVPSKPAIAILGHVLLKADGDALGFYATDLEVGMSTSCPASVHEPGRIALPVGKFLALVEQFSDADVSISLGGQQVIVQCGGFRSRLLASPADDFPEMPAPDGTTCLLDMEALRQLIACTRYAVASVGNKHVLRGALLTLSGSVAAMVGTDGKRLVLATKGRTGPDVTAIVPAKTLDVLADQGVGDVKMTVGTRHLFFQMDGRLLVSRMIDGEYPKYERIIPRDNDKIVSVDRITLAAALRRVAVVEEAVFIDVASGSLELTASSAEVGSASEKIAVDYEGLPLKVCVNGSYVLDFLNAALGQTITMALKDAKSAMLLTDGSDHICVVMLMRK